MHSLAIHLAPNLQSGSLALFLLLRFVHHVHCMPHTEKETVTEVVLSRSSFQHHDLQDQPPLTCDAQSGNYEHIFVSIII
jgi:hypothetical protein